ncbi:MAG TPA: hypothetical protein VF812_02865 [Ktedonobacterales bacterium]
MSASIDPDDALTSPAPSSEEPAAQPEAPRGAANWAPRATHLKVSDAPRNQVNNVDGRNAVGPLQGFGKMWQKTYRLKLIGSESTPQEVIATWKANFPRFWPRGNRFYVPLTGITPGEVALLTVRAGGVPLSTGVLVLYADEESFTLMTPQGHMFAGWITFSAFTQQDTTIAQAQVLMRANDPIYELGLTFGGHYAEDKFWSQTLQALGAYFSVTGQPVEKEVICVDPRLRWSYVGNIVHNAGIRTVLLGPTRWFRRP